MRISTSPISKLDKDGYLTTYGYTEKGDISRIQYADGKEVRLSYNPLRQLEELEDWLGITRIENDALGRAVKVQYPDGRTVSYAYGKAGERTSLTYPDGRSVSYSYDELVRLTELKDGEQSIHYTYNALGRLEEKEFPGGMTSRYAYDSQGRLESLIHRDQERILDAYTYQYDILGNKTGIEKQRRGLKEESGSYAYGYDALGRLSSVTKDETLLRSYAYDAFGNRTGLKEGERETSYTYNALNQLISLTDGETTEQYTYDKRGNLTELLRNGNLANQYVYGALIRLEKAVNADGVQASYQYNGLGYRTGKSIKESIPDPEKQIRYTIDLTRQYHNLLEKEEEGESLSFLWDGGIAGMRRTGTGGIEEEGTRLGMLEYYLQDDLGSPIRILNESGELTESYGYDEFGRDLYGNQGKVQPFGYTGYQYDQVSSTYFAQAREYVPDKGRFTSKDKGKYFIAIKANTWNLYNYCSCNPFHFIDPKGHENRDTLIDTAGQYIADNDKYGMQLGLHWLYGNGKEINISPELANIEGWKLYMESNKILTGKVGDVVVPIGEALDNGEEIDIDITMSMVIENGEGAVGYYFLHGTDVEAGGFQIKGTVSKNSRGDTSYDLTYTWNDVMDPNFLYSSDIKKSNAAKSIPFANPTDYNFTLSWHDVSVIKAHPGWFNWNKGWLKEYKSDWIDRLDKKTKLDFDFTNNEQISLTGLGWDKQLEQISNVLIVL